MGKSTPSPDMSAVYAAQASQAAAEKSYALGEDQLKFAKEQWAHDQPLIDQITQSSIKSQDQQSAFSKTMQDEYTNTYMPMARDYAAKAQAWDSPEKERFNAGQAQENVANQFEGQRNAALSQLEGFGIDPSSTRYAALDIGSRTAQAAAAAAAGTNAIQQTKMQGMGLQAGAVAMGQGNATGAIQATNAATGAGSAGAGATVGGLNAASNAMTQPTAWFNSGANNMNTYVNAVNGFNEAQAQESMAQAQQMAGIGSALGGIMGMMKFDEGGPVPVNGAPQAIPVGPQAGVPAPTQTPGGMVPPQASPTQGIATDDVPAMLTADEFVVPKDVVLWEGQKNLVGLIDKARKGQQQLAQRKDIGGEPAPAPARPPAPTFSSRPQAIPTAFH